MSDNLLQEVSRITGIPLSQLETELEEIIENKGLNKKTIDLEELRVIVAAYVRKIIKSFLDEDKKKTVDMQN